MYACLRCRADDAVVRELADGLEAAGFERGDEQDSERLRRRYAEQPQLHSSLAWLEDGEGQDAFWRRLEAALDALSGALRVARGRGAELELDLDPELRLDRALPDDRLCIDEVPVPHATLARLGALEVDLVVSLYRSTADDDGGEEE